MASERMVEQVLTEFALAYREKFPVRKNELPLLIGVWGRQLRRFTDGVVEQALGQVLDEVKYGPTINDLVERCWQIALPAHPPAGVAWGQIVHELRRGVSQYGRPVFTIGLVEQIVADWGWETFVAAFRAPESRELSILQGRFQEEYQTRADRFKAGLMRVPQVWDVADTVPLLPQPGEAETAPAPPADGDEYQDQRDPVVDAEMAALRAHIRSKPVLRALYEQARDEMAGLRAHLQAARAAGDFAREQAALQAIRHMRSPAAYRQAQVAFLEAARPGLSEELLRWPPECEMCHNQRVILVRWRDQAVVQPHWVKIKSIISYGQVYHCPKCVTPTVAERAMQNQRAAA